MESFKESVRRHRDFPGYPNVQGDDELYRLFKDRGCRVALTGEGGDECLAGSFGHYLDLIYSFRFYRAFREVNDEYGAGGLGELLKEVMKQLIWPRMPDRVKAKIKRALGRPVVPVWIDPGFAKRAGLENRLLANNGCDNYSHGVKFQTRELYENWRYAWSAHSYELDDRELSRQGIEHRYPFMDRRLVEFGIFLPEEQRQRNGLTKYILRNALRGYLPAAVLARRDKSEFSEVFIRQFRALGDERPYESMIIEELGWVNGGKVKEMYLKMKEFAAQGFPGEVTYLWQLWMLLGVELWAEANLTETGLRASDPKQPSNKYKNHCLHIISN